MRLPCCRIRQRDDTSTYVITPTASDFGYEGKLSKTSASLEERSVSVSSYNLTSEEVPRRPCE
ncbi:hypothetical protein EYF80_042514 [Liparis tanakae]|uniref:Uncharacterized protein n=1 Tax=Liparis tanakae TaxID=230148 RepID=A0A4Z2G155_9TELE|nr:hypothetical protein EYF80_042514 [Liparis tanakae]